MKKFLSLALVFLLVFSMTVSSFAAPVIKKVQPTEKTDLDKQIDFIFENLADLSQDSAEGLYDYTVTDLDHNNNLELIAAICNGPGNLTYAKIFEVSPERDAFIECDMSVAEGEPFVDIIQDSADTYYDKEKDVWHYMFAEDFTSSTSEHYAVKCSISLKDGYVTPAAYATEHCEIINGITAVTYEDMDGNLITPEEFNNAGTTAFKGFEKSGTNFEWFSLKDAKTVSVLSDSYKVFTGEKDPTNAKKPKNNITIVSEPKDNFLRIWKNPTSESCFSGATIYFVVGAYNADKYTWWFTSPAGDTFSLDQFREYFKQTGISGSGSPTLTIQNVPENMNNWGAYCICSGNGQTAQSSTAFVYVSHQPQVKSIGGTVIDQLMSTVTILMDNLTTVQVMKDICNVSGGSIDYGCTCTCYYSGDTPTASTITRVDIRGKSEPVYNSTSGTYSAAGSDGFAVGIYIPMIGSTVYVSPSIVNFTGSAYDGCPCTVYFTGNVPTGNSNGSIYRVDVIGIAPAPAPTPIPDYTWTCDFCGAWNLESNDYCTSCGNSRYNNDYTWTCNACGAWNLDKLTSCSSCGTSRYSEYTWTCNTCGAWNLESAISCSSCFAPRYHTGLLDEPVAPIYPGLIEDPVINPLPDSSGWICSTCGTHNGEFEASCSGCGASRQAIGLVDGVIF